MVRPKNLNLVLSGCALVERSSQGIPPSRTCERTDEQSVDVRVEVGANRRGDDVCGHVRRQGRVAVELSSFAQGLTRFKTSRTRPEPGLLASSFARSLPPPAGRQTV